MANEWVAAPAPGEFERQAAIVLGINQLFPFYPQLTVDLVSHLIGHVPLVGIVHDEDQRRQVITQFSDLGLPAHLMHFVFMPVRGAWIRDYGPGFARLSSGRVALLDAEYGIRSRPNDDIAPSALAILLQCPIARVPLTLEGGNLLGNGRGFCLTSSILIARNSHRNYKPEYIQNLLTAYYGYSEGMLVSPLQGEGTGHVDMFAAFLSPDTLLIGQYDPAVDPVNSRVLDETARALTGLRTAVGPLKVHRIPMPSNRDGVFRTYTNVLFANGKLLVPTYPATDPNLDELALSLFRQLMPDWQIIPIDCSKVVREHGVLRCLSLNVPWLDDRFSLVTPRPQRAAHRKLRIELQAAPA